MFDVGMPELIVILIVALLVIGPKKLPELAKALGKGLSELKNALQDMKDTVEEEFEETTSEIREAVTDVKKQIQAEVRDVGKTVGSSVQDVKKQFEAESEEINKTLRETEQGGEDHGEDGSGGAGKSS